MSLNEEITPKSRVVVDGDLSSEKLLQLIKLGLEEERLDYKNEYNLSGSRGTKDKIEFVRDVIGMANTYGGYIILGVHEVTDSSGKRFSAEGMTPEACASLDISTLRQQVEAYVSERIELHLKLHTLTEYGNKTFGIIFVPKSPHSPIIFSNDGQYTDKSDPRNRNITLFYSGDIVVRKGASTERADQSDVRRIISEIRQREKARWTEEILGMRDLVQRLDQLIAVLPSGNSLGHQQNIDNIPRPLEGVDETLLYLAPSVIYDKITDLLENQREVSVCRYIQRATSLFFQHLEDAKSGDENQILELRDNRLIPILDSLLAIGTTCIEYKFWELFDDIHGAFYRICYRAEKWNFPELRLTSFSFNKQWVWQEVMVRVYTLGAILVYRNHWLQAQKLIQQEVEWDDYYRSYYWSRYILIMAARAGQLEKKGWVPPAVDKIEAHEWLSNLFMSDKDQIINAVCQFDFLQCVYTAIAETGTIHGKRAYPSFGLFYKSRTEPIIAKLITPGVLRDSVSSLSDDQLAALIQDLNNLAAQEFFMYNGWDAWGWSDKRIKQFLDAHPSVEA